MLAADVIIAEFMADNGSVLFDEDGEASDWIELYNRGDAPQSLDGWFLTDNDNNLEKWRIPDVTLAPFESLIVWASSKGRDDPAGELHTNFGLSRGGEYLALVMPDGATVVSDFSPEFPSQFENLSYGYTTESTETVLVGHGADVQVLVPTGPGLGQSWTETSFIPDDAWRLGDSQGVGYDTNTDYQSLIGTAIPEMRGVNTSAYLRIPFSGAGPTDSLMLNIRYDDGFVAYLNGQEVARRNAPATVTWNSSAQADRPDAQATTAEVINLSQYASLIAAGDNVLAIHALNVSAGSSDILIDAELVGAQISVRTDEPPRFFLTPTPGEPNLAGSQDTRPFILDTSHSDVSDGADIEVQAEVIAMGSGIVAVELHYRVMYGHETVVTMYDDGLHGDDAAGDGIYGGSIPSSASDPGEMVRWYVTATAVDDAVGRFPYFTDPDSTTEYLGAVVPDPGVVSDLPIFQIFTPNPDWFRNTDGTINRNETSGSFYFDGNFYDNVRLSVRGQTSVGFAYPNQKFKVSFNDDNRFEFDDERDSLGSINLDNVYQDPSAARLTLGAWVFREAGAYAQLVEPVHTRMNGEFYSLGIFSERYNGPFLRRNGLGDEGALYESEGVTDAAGYLSPNAGNLGTTAGMEKDNREWEESFADLEELIAGISPGNPLRDQYIFDNVNVPEVINVLAGYSLTKHYDRDTHNFYVYRDTDGNGEWSLLPYDLDLIWDRLSEPVFSTYFSGHPFEGSSSDPTWVGTHWNRLVDAFADSPVLSAMLLRRLRTLMDEILQPLSTPQGDRVLEAMVDELAAKVEPEAELDLAKWGRVSGGAWRNLTSLDAGVAQLKQAFDRRRQYLYGLSIIPAAQQSAPVVQIGDIDASPISGDQDQEYIQLLNPSDTAVDISGWTLSDAVSYTFAKGVVIPAKGALYVTPDVVAFRARTAGPSGGMALFVQGGYEGHLSSSGETITLGRADGSVADTLTYTAGPELAPIADQTFSGAQTTLVVGLSASDDDTPTEDLTFSGAIVNKLYDLDQQYDFNDPNASATYQPYYQNYRGFQEKYLLNPNGTAGVDKWYYLTSAGDLYLHTGNETSSSPASLVGVLVASVGVEVYQDPSLLHDAVAQSSDITLSFTSGINPTMTLNAQPGAQGTYQAQVTVSDGAKTDTQTFEVTIQPSTTAAPVLAPIADQPATPNGVTGPIAIGVTDADTPVEQLTFVASAESQLYLLDQQLSLSNPQGPAPYGPYYQNYRGSGEKYLLNPAGTHPANRWYYLLPNGDFYRFTGTVSSSSPSSLQGVLIASLGAEVYADPSLLHSATSGASDLMFQINAGAIPSFLVAATANAAGVYVATLTASDAVKQDSKTFLVNVQVPTTAAPELSPIADQSASPNAVIGPIAIGVTDADTPTEQLTFMASAESQLYLLDQELSLSNPQGPAPYGPYYQNYRGSGEKYLVNPMGTHPTNRWYYLLPNGDFYRFAGEVSSSSPASLQGVKLASLGASTYADPSLLHSAGSRASDLVFQLATGASPSLTISVSANANGPYVAELIATDGSKQSEVSFLVGVQSTQSVEFALRYQPGDFDGSGQVDQGDKDLWRSTFGSRTDLRADGNNDGVVDSADYTVWRDNVGQVAANATDADGIEGPPVAFAYPPVEPSSAYLLQAAPPVEYGGTTSTPADACDLDLYHYHQVHDDSGKLQDQYTGTLIDSENADAEEQFKYEALDEAFSSVI